MRSIDLLQKALEIMERSMTCPFEDQSGEFFNEGVKKRCRGRTKYKTSFNCHQCQIEWFSAQILEFLKGQEKVHKKMMELKQTKPLLSSCSSQKVQVLSKGDSVWLERQLNLFLEKGFKVVSLSCYYYGGWTAVIIYEV